MYVRAIAQCCIAIVAAGALVMCGGSTDETAGSARRGPPYDLPVAADEEAPPSRESERPRAAGPTEVELQAELNESAAMKTLLALVRSQADFQKAAYADVDGNGIGEFGVFRELSAATPVRTEATGTFEGGQRVDPALLPEVYRSPNANYEVYQSGYLFKLFLPGAAGVAQAEGTASGVLWSGSRLDTQLAQTTWCCYAWPANYGISGRRTFFVNQLGRITAKDDSEMNGTGAMGRSQAGDALSKDGPRDSIVGELTIGEPGRDGHVWEGAD